MALIAAHSRVREQANGTRAQVDRSRTARLGDTAHQVVVGTLDPGEILGASCRPTACRS